MGLTLPVNKTLDSTIASKVNKLKADTSALKALHLSAQDVSKMDSTVKSFWKPINLYEACTENSQKADQYFNDWAVKLNLDTGTFIKTTNLDIKSKIIVGIKKNELELLQRLEKGI
jgi:hypothetical protein